ncbi:hypothetical protein [Streptomyces sp. NPDC090025]|uniref:hypothetical protein n=1 Tax=Streptomyces sp. NPDC090025 TaxID=3365922 RepID=UPI0038357A61
MRAIRAASAAALLGPLAAVSLALAAPATAADDGFAPGDIGFLKDDVPPREDPKEDGGGSGHDITSFGFSVTPSTVAAGGTVTLKADGCEVPTVTVESGIFDTVTLNEGHQGTATVDTDAKAGAQYEITFVCKGERGTTTLTVADHQGGNHQSGDHQGGAHKGVKAGYGSGATDAVGVPADSIGVTELATGGVLIAGALGAAVVLMRRRDTTGS